jgi:hypothetical protein
MFGIDEIYESLLLEAKSPEEIKKILQYQFVDGKGVPQDILDAVFNLDNTKKKTYTKWVLMQWGEYSKDIKMALKYGKLKRMFDYYQKRAGSGLQLTAMKSFPEAMDMVPVEEDPIFKPISSEEAELPENDYAVVYKTDEWIIVHPNTYEAELKIAQGCKWCTANAYGNGLDYWKRYSQKGPLWVNFDLRNGGEIAPMNNKEYPYKRYQFCFESSITGEFTNCHNVSLNSEMVEIPEEVIEFYGNMDESYAEKLKMIADDIDMDAVWDRYDDQRLDASIYRRDFSDIIGDDYVLLVMPERHYEPVMEDDDAYYVYDSEDYVDPIRELAINKDNPVHKEYDNIPLVIFNPTTFNTGIGYIAVAYRRYSGNQGYWDVYVDTTILDENTTTVVYRDYDYQFAVSSSEAKWFTFNLQDEIDNERDIKGVHILDASAVDKNTIYLQIDYRQYSSVVVISKNESASEIFIKKDWVKKGTLFQFEQDERGVYIQGSVRKYYIDSKNDSSEDYHIEERISDGIGYRYIVSNEMGDVALYDPNIGGVELSDMSLNYDIDEACGILKYAPAENLRCERIYDFKSKKLYPYVAYGQFFQLGPKKYIFRDATDDVIYAIDLNTNKKLGPFLRANWYSTTLNRYLRVTLPDEQFAFFDFKLFELKDITFDRVIAENSSMPYVIMKKGEEIILYNLITDDIVTKGVTAPLMQPLGVKTFSSHDEPILVGTQNGKYNIYTTSKGFLFDEDFDKPVKCVGSSTFVMERNNKIYVYAFNMGGGLRLISTQQGVDCTNITDVLVNGNALYFVININHQTILVRYDYASNEINIENKEEVTDENIINYVQRLFFPQQSQISENFKRLLDRMNNL